MMHKVKFCIDTTTVPVVEFHVGDGEVAYAVVDTGSESTLVDARFAKQHKAYFSVIPTQAAMNIIGVDTKREIKIANCDGVLKLEDEENKECSILVTGAVLYDLSHLSTALSNEQAEPVSIAVVIGSDTLKSIDARIDMKRKTLSFGYDLSGK